MVIQGLAIVLASDDVTGVDDVAIPVLEAINGALTLYHWLTSKKAAPPAYPSDPSKPPGPGWEWRGAPNSTPGSAEGSWYNPNTGESLHPDLDHKDPIGPH